MSRITFPIEIPESRQVTLQLPANVKPGPTTLEIEIDRDSSKPIEVHLSPIAPEIIRNRNVSAEGKSVSHSGVLREIKDHS